MIILNEEISTQKDASATHTDPTDLENLSEFIVSLIQALLRTGYYTPEHPQSKKAKEGLYSMFQELDLQKGELTLIVRETAEKKHMFLEGSHSKPLDLPTLMPRGMAELYDEKLMLFLERKELISLTLKQKMEREEFYNFIDIMSEPILTDIQVKNQEALQYNPPMWGQRAPRRLWYGSSASPSLSRNAPAPAYRHDNSNSSGPPPSPMPHCCRGLYFLCPV